MCLCSKTGTATVPNKEFWVSFPSLVAAGFRFTFVDWFGLRGTKNGYTASKLSDVHESYGTL